MRNACASALNNPRFVLSGWPELANEDRDEIARYLMGQTKNQPPPALRSRVDAIEQIDDALRESKSSERAKAIPRSLDMFTQDELDQRSGARPGSYLQQWFSDLRSFAEVVKGADGPKLNAEAIESFNLNARSDWRRLIKAFEQVHSDRFHEGHRALMAASAMIDLAYNRKVALSLGAPFQRESAMGQIEQELIIEDPDATKLSREATFLSERTNAERLSGSSQSSV